MLYGVQAFINDHPVETYKFRANDLESAKRYAGSTVHREARDEFGPYVKLGPAFVLNGAMDPRGEQAARALALINA